MVSHVLLRYIAAQLIRELACCKSPLPQANLCVTVHKVNLQTIYSVEIHLLAPPGHSPVSQSFSLDNSLALDSYVFIKIYLLQPTELSIVSYYYS